MFSFELSSFGLHAIVFAFLCEIGKLAYTEWTRRQGKPMTISEEFALCEELEKNTRTPEELARVNEMRGRIYKKIGESRFRKAIKITLTAIFYYCPLAIVCTLWIIHMAITGTWSMPYVIAIILILFMEALGNIVGIVAVKQARPIGKHFN